MKRSSTEVSLTPSNESDIDIDIKPDLTSPSKKSKKTPSPVKSKTKPKPKSPTKVKKEGDPQNGEWDKEKRAVFMDLIIAAGYKAVNLDEVAASVSPRYIYVSMVVLMIIVGHGEETVDQSIDSWAKGKFSRESGLGC